VVSVTSTRRTTSTAPAAAPKTKPKSEEAAFLSKWLKVWVGLLCVVTLVVVGYLTFITNSLADINGNLGTVSREVGGAGANATNLPSHVDNINASLGKIDTALKPIPGQAGEIVTALSSINDKLTETDSSLKDTADALTTVLGSVGAIGTTLVDADEPADNMGVQDIHQRIARLNGRNSSTIGSASAGGTPGPFGSTGGNLAAASADATVISGQIQAINTHLLGVCSSAVGSLLTTGLVAGLVGGLLGGAAAPAGSCA